MACGIGAIGFLVGQHSSSMESNITESPIGHRICVDDALDSLPDANGCSDELAAKDIESQRLVDGISLHSVSAPSADSGNPSSPSSESELPERRQVDLRPAPSSCTPCRSLHGGAPLAHLERQAAPHLGWKPTFGVGIGCAVFIGAANGSFMVSFLSHFIRPLTVARMLLQPAVKCISECCLVRVWICLDGTGQYC